MPSPYNTYVSPIDRARAFSDLRGRVQANKEARETAPIRQGLLSQERQLNQQAIERNAFQMGEAKRNRDLAVQAQNRFREVSDAIQQVVEIDSMPDAWSRARGFSNAALKYSQAGDGERAALYNKLATAPQDVQDNFLNAAKQKAAAEFPDQFGQLVQQTGSPVNWQIKENQSGGYTAINPRTLEERDLRTGAPTGSNIPADVASFEVYRNLSPEDQRLWDRNKRGESLTEQEKVDLAYKTRQAQEQARIDMAARAIETPGTPENRAEQERIAAEQDRLAAEQKSKREIRDSWIATQGAVKVAERLVDAASKGTTGFWQSVFKWVPGTEQFDFERDANTLKSIIALQSMNTLKRNSPTGSTGFGQLSNKELGVLQEQLGNLSTSQSLEQFKDRATEILRHYQRAEKLLKLEYMPPATDLERRSAQIDQVGLDEETKGMILFLDGLADPPALSGKPENVDPMRPPIPGYILMRDRETLERAWVSPDGETVINIK